MGVNAPLKCLQGRPGYCVFFPCDLLGGAKSIWKPVHLAMHLSFGLGFYEVFLI